MARKRICDRDAGREKLTFYCSHYQYTDGKDAQLMGTLFCKRSLVCVVSGARTNLKVEERHRSGAKVGGGHRSGVKHWKKIGCAPPLLVSAFVVVSTVWSVSCLLFFYSRCPPCVAICKSGRHVSLPHAPWSRRHCVWSLGRLDGLLCQLKLKFTLSSFIPTKIQITFIS